MSHYPFLTELKPNRFVSKNIYAVFGNPIGHSKSPLIHERFAIQTQQEMDYLRIQPSVDGFAAMLTQFFVLGGKGASVTIPFKLDAYQLCKQLTTRARLAGAVNTVWQKDGVLWGDNTDGAGLVADLLSQGVAICEADVLIVGAGGASRGIIEPLLNQKPKRIWIANRTAQKAHELVSIFQSLATELDVELMASSIAQLEDQTTPAFSLVINSSSAGLEDQSPLSTLAADHVFCPGCFAYDLVYGKTTVFMEQALQRGCRISDGLGMLVEQAAVAFSQWHQVDIKCLDTRAVIAQLRYA
ncbi:shikimate dehydrogenase [Polynucleobacter sp. HIN6]|uniref:shikimate dehydrogenase n=1 Tax=Polynucleobacter sp. HIN6 TaxID=3047865 RepID=UPI0025722618|nr:shikimate dehydrogenase [Polynucleobacter sp. HIN6]BEI34691.1 shikimate dehydrogenase [Polynucleobacter sp. HIN6]